MAEDSSGGSMLVLMPRERCVTRRTERGGVLEVYPDVHLAEKPPGGIWRATDVPDRLIAKLSPLTLVLREDLYETTRPGSPSLEGAGEGERRGQSPRPPADR